MRTNLYRGDKWYGRIKVLGTSFNLRSFAADNRSTATLISGKIEVKTSSRRVELSPNHQADCG